jgi:MFS family permease
MSGVGGAIFGYVADRFGRTRALMGTILIFSLASLGAATSQTVLQLLIWRAILGIGMGGEWASGAVLVSETWPAHLRNKAISIMQSGWALGYMAASISAALILGSPSLGADAWRWLFVVGVVPAFFTLWIRRYVKEPETWTKKTQTTGGRSPFAVIFGPSLLKRTLLIIALGAACSSRTGDCSSGCQRSLPVPSSRAARAWASLDRCRGSSRCSSARTRAI